MDLNLAGKKVLIAGATRGIGRSIIECFNDEGCHIGFCARDKEQVEAAVNKLKRPDQTIVGDAVDINNINKFQEWVCSTAEILNGVDIYISNVSAQSFDWQESFHTDIFACAKGIEMVLPFLKKSNSASITAIASKAALLSVPSYKPYSALKAALISYMSSLSRELAPSGIRVNCVSPGEVYFEGGFWHRIHHEDPELYQKVLNSNPFGRFCRPDEVAKTVVFLSSTAASFVSGANLLVDGAGREHVQF